MTIRNRSKNADSNQLYYSSWSSSSSSGPWSPISVNTPWLAEHIEESMIDDTDSNIQSWKVCEHFKCHISRVPYSHISKKGATWYKLQNSYGVSAAEILFILRSVGDNFVPVTRKDMKKRYMDPLRLDLALFLAEFSQTMELLKLPRKFLKNAWTSLRQKPITRRSRVRLSSSISRKVGKTAADAYLSAKFGIEPLARDLADFQRAYQLILAKWRELQNRRTQWEKFTKTQNRGFIKIVDHESGGWMLRTTIKCSVERKTAWRMKPIVPPIDFPPLAFSLDLLNAVPNAKTLWELKPMSFVFDWFANFGDVLDSVDPTGMSLPVEKSGIGSYWKVSMSAVTVVHNDTYWDVGKQTGLVVATATATRFMRTYKVGFVDIDPLELKVKNPFKKTSDAGKALTGLALAKQKSSGLQTSRQ